MKMQGIGLRLVAWMALSGAAASAAGIPDEFEIKRQEVFGFTAKPSVVRRGDIATIRFAVSAACDVTVAIETGTGRIFRHLACGVLGPNAPEPFQKNSLAQTLAWDGKDDRGRYADRDLALTLRVSLGLKPRFERTLFWSPYKRLHQGAGRWGFVGTQGGLPTPRIAAAPEGVYVFEGRGFDHLRLFDHDGNYLRTVYPPPAGAIDRMAGLEMFAFPQDPSLRLPLKRDILQSTFLTSGPSGLREQVSPMFGSAATALAVRAGPDQTRIALVHRSLNRLAGDGGSPRAADAPARLLPLTGPKSCRPIHLVLDGIEMRNWLVSPTSAAFGPDGRTLYCAGHMWRQGRHSSRIDKECLHGVIALDYDSDEPARIFAGSLAMHDSGTAAGRFRDATSVDCDSQGRVYVSDYMNDRLQVFAPDGRHLRDITVAKPALVRVHRRTDELFVFSWVYDHGETLGRESESREIAIPPRLIRMGTFADPKVQATFPLPLLNHGGRYNSSKEWGGLEYTAEIDSWADRLTVWLVPGVPGAAMAIQAESAGGRPDLWRQSAVKLLVEQDGKLVVKRDFADDAEQAVVRLIPPLFGRQRLNVNPRSGLLYVAEGQLGNGKFFKEVIEIDPATGRSREVALPFDAEDMTFDAEGLLYLRSHDLLVRYELPTWREVPFDYGEERKRVGTSSSSNGRRRDVISGLPLYNGTGWHKGGIYVNTRGNIIASCLVTKGDAVPFLELVTDEKQVSQGPRAPYYTPAMYPGRLRFGEVHIWDERGKMIHEDAVQGLVDLYGVGLDRDDNIYVLAAPTRVIDGQRYFDRLAGTVMKFAPGRGRLVARTSHLIPVPLADVPAGPPHLYKNATDFWVEGASWMYGGVGYCGKNPVELGGHCACYNCRFALDYFGRSFAPETRRFNVAVLDCNGNLILRMGRFGNVDDGRPLITAGGPAEPRPLGGDEIALMHGAYVAADTDRRLFIADPGNARILSVKLDYGATERVPLPHGRD